MAGMFLDGVIVILLLVTIGYCWRLSKKITLLRNGKEELNLFIKDFNDAVTRAEYNISELKSLGGDADKKLSVNIDKARFIANDLSFLMHKGENVADTLEHYINSSKSIGGGSVSTPRASKSNLDKTNFVTTPHKNATRNRLENKTGTEQLILRQKSHKATQSAKQNQSKAGNFYKKDTPKQDVKPKSGKMSPSKKRALDEVLSQIAARKKTPESSSVNKAFDKKPLSSLKVT